MAKRKPGLPENHDLGIDLGSLAEPADLPDFLDMPSPRPPAPVVPAPAPPVATPAATAAPRVEIPRPPKQPALTVVARPEVAPAPAAPPVSVPPPDTDQKFKVSKGKVRHRPPRRELGFDDETLGMLKDLHLDGLSQSQEESLTRSEVARAALRAVHAARKLVDYSRIGPRGKWGTASARGLVDDLTESFIRAVGQLYVERYQSDSSRP